MAEKEVIWKPISNVPGYFVCNNGEVAEGNKKGRISKKRVPTYFDPSKNVLVVRLRVPEGGMKSFAVKHLVANAFIPQRGKDRVYIYFRDGNHKNCDYTNLVRMNLYELHNVVTKVNLEDPKSSLSCIRIVVDKETKKRYIGYKLAAEATGWSPAGVAYDATKKQRKFRIEYKEF